MINVRLSEEDYERWHREAGERRMTLSGLLRVSVDQFVSSRSPRVFASQVAQELAPLLLSGLRDTPAEPVLSLGVGSLARQFDRACVDAEFHRPTVFCSGCGGSVY